MDLLGSGLRPWDWLEDKKSNFLMSRVKPTRVLRKFAEDMQKAASLESAGGADTELTLFLTASGIGAYGNDKFKSTTLPADLATEKHDTSNAPGFLAQVSREWEAAAGPSTKGLRVIPLRLAPVLSNPSTNPKASKGVLASLLGPFQLGLGGVVGSGDQYFPWVSERDAVGGICHILANPSRIPDPWEGQSNSPINIISPGIITNAQFTKALGSVLGRPTTIPMPALIAGMLFGEMGTEVLVGGAAGKCDLLRVVVGYEFKDTTIVKGLKNLISNPTT